MATTYTTIRRPLITEKALGVKETEGTLVFEVAADATKTAVKAGGRSALQGEGVDRAHGELCGKERRRGKFTGFRPDWKKAYVRLKAGEKMPEYVDSL